MEKWLQDLNAVPTPVGYVHPKTGELLKAVRLDIASAKDSSVDKDKPEEVAQGHKVETENGPVVVDADTKVETDPMVIDAGSVVVDADAKVETGSAVVDTDANADVPQPTSDPVAVDAGAKVETDPVVVDADTKVDVPQPTSEPKKRGKASK